MRRAKLLPLLAAATLALATAASVAAAPAQEASAAAMEEVTPELCAACHEDVVNAFTADNPHAAMDAPDWHGRSPGALSCAGCHGDPSAHLEAGGGKETIFSFDESNGHVVNAKRCLACHGDVHPRFFQSPHAAAGMDCTSCHTIHGEKMPHTPLLQAAHVTQGPMDRISASSLFCKQCHGEVFTQFEFNERHRLREGILECKSCHDPHAAQSRILLGGFKQQQCLECHADKGGPYTFEHGSVMVEGCVACHAPHGSPNRHMLKYQRVAELCFSCHASPPSFHSRFTLDTVCTNCHSSIHGSNFSPFFLE